MTKSLSAMTYRWARRIAVAVVGGTVLLVGIALTVLPGPAIVVIPAGLAILSIEFAWARRWLRKVRSAAGDIVNGVRSSPSPSTGEPQERQVASGKRDVG
jgi:4-amino-4-deoxy-L-arabinose transferase-like glycosyltransferase